MSEIIDNYHNVQQDVMETFIDRGQLQPEVLRNSVRAQTLAVGVLRHFSWR
jgi:hypothetical protein